MDEVIGIYGGTFDPIHLGHLITAQYVYEIRKLSKVLFIPCNVSPFKIGAKSTSKEDRLNMVKLAIEDIPYFSINDYEIKNQGISYTINTLKYLKSRYENLELIIGYDNLLKFEEWKDPDEIVKLAKLVVLGRNTQHDEKENRFFKFAEFVNTPRIDISASEIRRRVKENLPIDFLVPPQIKNYIFEKGLYR
jgi:nicotinate-nucleotide adenylyltransferase